MCNQQQLAKARDRHDQAADAQCRTDYEAYAGRILVLTHADQYMPRPACQGCPISQVQSRYPSPRLRACSAVLFRRDLRSVLHFEENKCGPLPLSSVKEAASGFRSASMDCMVAPSFPDFAAEFPASTGTRLASARDHLRLR